MPHDETTHNGRTSTTTTYWFPEETVNMNRVGRHMLFTFENKNETNKNLVNAVNQIWKLNARLDAWETYDNEEYPSLKYPKQDRPDKDNTWNMSDIVVRNFVGESVVLKIAIMDVYGSALVDGIALSEYLNATFPDKKYNISQ
jgi:hypothetical protein